MRIAWSLPDGATWVDGQAVNVAARVADVTEAALAREVPPRETTEQRTTGPHLGGRLRFSRTATRRG